MSLGPVSQYGSDNIFGFRPNSPVVLPLNAEYEVKNSAG